MDAETYLRIMKVNNHPKSGNNEDVCKNISRQGAWFYCCCGAHKKPNIVTPEVSNDDPLRWNSVSSNLALELSVQQGASFEKLNPNQGGDLLASLRVPLIIGACLGLIPIRKLVKCGNFCQRNNERPKFTWLHYRTLITGIVTGSLLMHTFFITHNFLKMTGGKNSAGSLVLTFSGVWFYSVGTLIYVFFLVRSKSLCQYFDEWISTSIQVSEWLLPDKRVRKDILLITTALLLDCLGENIFYHFHAMQYVHRSKLGSLTLSDLLKDYYNSNQYIFPFFSYSPLLTFTLFLTNKLATYAWNMGDVILILLSRALYGRYLGLNRFLEAQLQCDGCICMIRQGSVSWSSIRKSFLLLNDLLQKGNKVFAPLIWISYTTDIFFVCRQLYEGLASSSSERTVVNKIYVAWSLLHLIVRTLGVNMMSAAISEEAHRLSKILQHVHPDEYDDEVRRLELYLGSRIIGITGSGCFIITRSFVLMIISAIFTLEVVLLQNAHLTVG